MSQLSNQHLRSSRCTNRNTKSYVGNEAAFDYHSDDEGDNNIYCNCDQNADRDGEFEYLAHKSSEDETRTNRFSTVLCQVIASPSQSSMHTGSGPQNAQNHLPSFKNNQASIAHDAEGKFKYYYDAS